VSEEILPGTLSCAAVIDRPIVYRPRTATITVMVIVGLLALPVAALISSRSWVFGLIAAVAVSPFILIVYMLGLSQKMTLTDNGIYVVTDSEGLMLAWPEIRSFDSAGTLQIVMHSGKVHDVPWIATANAQRFLGTLGYADYVAAELNVMLMEQTGQTQPGVDTNDIRPRLTAETPAGRAWLARSAAAGSAAAGAGIVAVGRTWWGFLLWGVTVWSVWQMVKRRRAEAKEPSDS
jgi:hypothetical protein